MGEIHPLVVAALLPLLVLFFGGILWLMQWNSDRIRRQRAVASTGQVTVAAVSPAPIATAAPRPAPAPAAAVPTPTPAAADQLLPLPAWLDLVQHRLDDAPHTLIVGPTGTGKTTLVKALCAMRDGQLLFVSPKPNAWPGLSYPTIDDDGGFTAIETALQAVLRELRQRLAAMKHGTDPSTFGTLTVIIDEFPTVVDECETAPVLLRKLGQIGRELRLRLIALSQTLQVKDLGIEGQGAARENVAQLVLPRSTARVSGLLRLAADDAPQGIDLAGIYELSQQAIPSERWWEPPASDISVSAVQGAVYQANTANTRDTDTPIQIGETRQEAIRELARLGATRKQIALAMGAITMMPMPSSKNA